MQPASKRINEDLHKKIPAITARAHTATLATSSFLCTVGVALGTAGVLPLLIERRSHRDASAAFFCWQINDVLEKWKIIFTTPISSR